MKVVKNILCGLIVFSILNVFCAKSIHELFFHNHHHEAQCDVKSIQHFHEHETPTVDLICSFNFSFFATSSIISSFDIVLEYFKRVFSTQVEQPAFQEAFHLFELRGPPVL